MFKWLCLGVAVVALCIFGWMLNEMRVEVKNLAAKTDAQLPRIMTQSERVTGQLDAHLPKLLQQAETAATNINSHLPKILTNAEQATERLNRELPALLANSEKTLFILDTNMPRLIVSSEGALESVSELSGSFGMYKSLMGIVHPASQDKGLFSYGSSILSLLGDQPATTTIGLKKAGSDSPLRAVMPAKDWANAAKKDNHFLSLVSTSKAEVLNGLARTNSPLAYHIKIGDKAPRLLADWLKETHGESKDVN